MDLPTNQIILVGHPSSGIEMAEEMLLRSGVKSAQPSRREGLLPKDFITILCNAYHVPSLESCVTEAQFRQIEPAGIWKEMALDIAIGNSEQNLWCWSESRAIFLLDYYLTLVPRSAALLIYDEPGSVLRVDELTGNPADDAVIQRKFDNWTAYNLALLQVFRRHPDRCVLYSSRQKHRLPEAVTQKLNISLHPLRSKQDCPGFARGRNESVGPDDSDSKDVKRESSMNALLRDGIEIKFSRVADAGRQFRINSILQENSACGKLYNEVQSAADLPDSDGATLSTEVEPVWEWLLVRPGQLAGSYCQLYRELLRFHAIEKLAGEENERMFLKLQQAREELDESALKNKRLNEVQTSAAEKRLKRQLPYRLGSTMVSCSRTLKGWLWMPFALARQFKHSDEEDGEDGSEKINARPARKSDDSGSQIRNQLSYRLGSTLVKNARSPVGWIKLPFALVSETVAFKRNQRRKRN